MNILILGGDGYLGWPQAMYLSRRGHERNGAGLCGHYRQANSAPALGRVSFEVSVEVIPMPGSPRPINGDAQDRDDEDDEIEQTHLNILPSAKSSPTQRTKLASTRK